MRGFISGYISADTFGFKECFECFQNIIIENNVKFLREYCIFKLN